MKAVNSSKSVTVTKSRYPQPAPTLLAMICASLLAACGGGDGGSPATGAASTPAAPAATASITGKAIDGYLVGATACLDLNANNACDDGEPSAVTGANGDFTIPYDGDTHGKRLVVQVTPATRDLSRPAGFTFPASFAMTAVLDGGTSGQHVSPLTSLVTAQMEAGMSRDEALAAVRTLLGASVDPTVDYMNAGDAASASVAAAIVDKITSLAASGKADAAAVRNTLNAMIAKGDVAVAQTDVDAQAAKPLYALTDASKALAQPLYSYIDATFTGSAGVMGSMVPVQMVQKIDGDNLQKALQVRRTQDGAWEALPDTESAALNDPANVFLMKADGSWSDMVSRAQWRAPQPLTAIGRTLAGRDPLTGITFKYESRDVDLSGQAATLAVTGGMFGPLPFYTSGMLGNARLPDGTHGYLGIQSYDADRVVLPMNMTYSGCQVPVLISSGANCPIQANAPYDPATPQNDPLLPSPLTSVQQLVGRSFYDTVITQRQIDIAADGTVTMSMPMASSVVTQMIGGQPSANALPSFATVTGTWSVYDRNPNVMVFNLSRADAATVAQFGVNAGTLAQGAKVVFAIRAGQLHVGVLFPAGYAERSVQFPNALPSVLTTMQLPN